MPLSHSTATINSCQNQQNFTGTSICKEVPGLYQSLHTSGTTCKTYSFSSSSLLSLLSFSKGHIRSLIAVSQKKFQGDVSELTPAMPRASDEALNAPPDITGNIPVTLAWRRQVSFNNLLSELATNTHRAGSCQSMGQANSHWPANRTPHSSLPSALP